MPYNLKSFKCFFTEYINESIVVDKALKERKSKNWKTFHYRHEPIFKRKKDYYRVDYKLFDSNWRTKFRNRLSPKAYKEQILEPDKEYHREYRNKLRKVNKKSLRNMVLTSGEKRLLKKYEDAMALNAKTKREARAINSEFSAKVKKLSEIIADKYAENYEKKTGKKLSEERREKIRIALKRRLNGLRGVHATANDIEIAKEKARKLTGIEKERMKGYDKQRKDFEKTIKDCEKEGIIDKEGKKEFVKEIKDTKVGKIMYRDEK